MCNVDVKLKAEARYSTILHAIAFQASSEFSRAIRSFYVMQNNEPSSRVQFLATLIRGDGKNVDSTLSFFTLHVDRVCSNIKSCREAAKRYNLVA